jgi:alkyl sulfatase BDS1-like metallo-beta-lactamase superfamily hydrolase
MMGGSAKIIAKGRELMNQGKYLAAVEILNKLVFAELRNQPARDLLADAYEQLGYQAESTSARNTFLQGAFELRNGMPAQGGAHSSMSPDVVRAMTTEQWLDFLAISMDPKKSEGLHYRINLVTPDNGEKFAVELENATLTTIAGFQIAEPDLTITVNRADLNRVMMGVAGFDQLATEGKAKFDGDRTIIGKLRDLMVTFTPDFEVLPGTAPTQRQVPPGRPFALPDPIPAALGGSPPPPPVLQPARARFQFRGRARCAGPDNHVSR